MALLQDKNIVVTGAGSGIGLGIAGRCIANGANVHICDVDPDALAIAKATFPDVHTHVADVAAPDAVRAFFEEVAGSCEAIDALVNNAGIGGPTGQIEDIDDAEWARTIAVNLTGMFYCIKQVLPGMKQRRSGAIINISTASTRTGLPLRTPYIAAKAGVEGLTHTLAREVGQFNIRCNAILPGMVDNERGRRLIRHDAERFGISYDEAMARQLAYISMRCAISVEEIGDIAVFLASDAARHVTAQMIGIDGNMEWEI